MVTDGEDVCGAGNSSVPLMKQTGNDAGIAGVAARGNGGTRMKADDVDDDDGADEQEPRQDSPRPTAPRAVGAVGRLRDRVGRGLLARHACSTHRSAA